MATSSWQAGFVSKQNSSPKSVAPREMLALIPLSATASQTSSQKVYISETDVVPKRRHSARDSSVAAFTQRPSRRSSVGKM